jgi:hypothetical protein
MAIPWTTIASAIPWSEVIGRTPEVLRGAKKLWQRVGGRGEAGPAAPPPAPTASAAERLAWLEARYQEQEARAQEGADLLAKLAEQQSGLIAEVARLHRRTRRLALAVAVLGVVLAATVTALLSP